MNYTITSKDNRLIKHIKTLHHKKYRDSEGQFFVEGIKMAREAVQQGADILHILVCPDMLRKVSGGEDLLDNLIRLKFSLNSVPENIFGYISDTETPQGVLAVISKAKKLTAGAEFNPNGVYILLDGVQDPGNVGTIIRTSDALGADGVILSKGCADVYSPKVLRSSMGSIFRVSIFEKANLREFAGEMQTSGVKIIASSLQASHYHFDISYNGGVGLVIGNESNGVSTELLEIADYIIKIPMKGGAESLNASVAAGVLMYEVMRDRMKRGLL